MEQDLSYTFTVDKPAIDVFNDINNVAAWWTDSLEGNSKELGDEFAVRFWDVHYSKHRLTELVPGKKIVWLTIDGQLNFIADNTEWTGTSIVFDIAEQDGHTEVRFTHQGLSPAVECYNNCANAWAGYITGSLKKLIETGQGEPTLKTSMM